MAKSIVAEGKTTNEAIENGLKKLNVSKENVDIKVIEEKDKRSFFNILTPRVVKVELTVKENAEVSHKNEENKENIKEHKEQKEERVISEEDLNQAKSNVESFLEQFFKNISTDVKTEVLIKDNLLEVNIDGKEIGYLIGYRGETLYAFQNILSQVASKNTKNRIRVILDIAGYKEKRKKTLEDLAEKTANRVIRTGRSVALEPMRPYERKIIHSKLQENSKVTTKSTGEEPKRKVIVSLIK